MRIDLKQSIQKLTLEISIKYKYKLNWCSVEKAYDTFASNLLHYFCVGSRQESECKCSKEFLFGILYYIHTTVRASDTSTMQ